MARPRTVRTRNSALALAALLLAVNPAGASGATPMSAPARLAERQFLCGLFGTCDTSTSAAASSAATGTGTAAGTSRAVVGTSAAGTTTSAVNVPAVGTATSASSALVPTATSVVLPTETSAPVVRSPSSMTTSSSTSSARASSSATSSASQIIVTVTSVLTNSDGSESTMIQQSASAVPVKNNTSSGPSGKTWGIIGGVIGGVVVLAGLVLIGWRLTQRRFSNLDAEADDIRWPELQPDGGLATLNPQGTRRTGGAGFAMEKDHDEEYDEDEMDRKGGRGAAGEWAGEGSPRFGEGPGAAGHYALGNNASEASFFEGQGGGTPYELAYRQAQGQQASPPGGRNSYYDPYLPHPSTSDPSLVPLSHPGAANASYAPPVYPPTYAHAHYSADELAVQYPYRATSPRQGY